MTFYWPPSNKVAGQAGAVADFDAAYGAGAQVAQALAQAYGYPGLSASAAMDQIRSIITAGTELADLDNTGNVPASQLGNVPRGLQFLTGGGNLTLTMLQNAQNAGYGGVYLDPHFTWNAAGLSIVGLSNFVIASDMWGSVGYQGIYSYNTGGYINTGTSTGVDGIQVYGNGSNATNGVMFHNCVFVGASTNANVHFGGRQRRCGLSWCTSINTGTMSFSFNGTNGTNVSTLTGSQSVTTTTLPANLPTSGQVLVQTVNQGVAGLALITYGGITGSTTLTSCKTVNGAGTMVSGSGASLMAPPQAALALDTAISATNSEDNRFDHIDCYSVSGVAISVDGASVSGHANDTYWGDVTTATTGGFCSLLGGGGGGHGFFKYYDRSPQGSAPLATVWNDASVFVFVQGEDQNNAATGTTGFTFATAFGVTHLVSGSGVTVSDSRNMSLNTNSGFQTVVATVTGGILKSGGRGRWSGIINVLGTGTLDLSDSSGWFNNGSAGPVYVQGTATLVVSGNYPSAVSGAPVVTGSASNPVATSFTGQILLPYGAGDLGDGSAGAVNLNGTNTFSWATLVGSIYTMTGDAYATSLTIASGVTLATNGWRIWGAGAVINNGTLSYPGPNATSSTGGNNSSGGPLTQNGGGNGATGAGAAGGNSGTLMGVGNAGAGGTGSSGAGGAGVTAKATSQIFRSCPAVVQTCAIGWNSGNLRLGGGGSGGGGGGDGTNKGGGGGSGGGMILITCYIFVNNGTVNVSGGNGFTPTTGNCGGGGAGAGGILLVYSAAASTLGTVTASAGTPGSGVGSGTAGGTATAGSGVNFVMS